MLLSLSLSLSLNVSLNVSMISHSRLHCCECEHLCRLQVCVLRRRNEDVTIDMLILVFPYIRCGIRAAETNRCRRIINAALVDEYAYLLAAGGWLYTISDVKDTAMWMKEHLDVRLTRCMF